MIRDSGFVGFVFIGQLAPFFLADRLSVFIFLVISGMVLLAHLKVLRNSLIVSRRYLIVAELIMTLLALGVIEFNHPASWAAFLMSFTVVLILSDWINLRTLCRWFALRKKQTTFEDLALPEYFAIVIANFGQLVLDFKDSRRYALGSETGGLFSKFVETVISFLVHIYRVGERITRVTQIRRFRFGIIYGANDRFVWLNLAWIANAFLIALLYCSMRRLV